MGDRRVVEDAFEEWANGEGHVSRLFAEDMTWEIAGRSAVSGRYASAADFVAGVLEPFAWRFPADHPFRPVRIRSVLEDAGTVVVVWDGAGTTVAGTPYENTYAWILRMRDGRIVDGLAFFDGSAFDELWFGVPPRNAGGG
ncbi:nuclear transport factor 2 family protein [Microbacterium sp. BWT-B31]|uniref:nuclear transport factor 2 family protein n=1 Tax=Microbacterium sp. BWT-B31 TaxID=3232072 RepID=UPI003529783E